MRVLILDDQPGLADLLALGLRAAGYPAWGFTLPTEALAALHDYDVLVTDYHMPGMTGLDVARHAYAAGWRHPLLRLVLEKPFPPQDLARVMPELERKTF